MEKFIKMTVSYIDSSRGVCLGGWSEDVHNSGTCHRLRHRGECDLLDYLLDNHISLTKKA